MPANEDVLGATLRLVTLLAQATVGGADGVSVSLRRRARLVTVASSDETVLDMDHDQYATGEGPCIDAAEQGRWFHVASLDDESRWPAFIPRASARGIASILSTPLLAPVQPVGALNIYSRRARAFAHGDQALASLFAAQTSAVLASAHIDVTAEQVAARLQEALHARELIAQAQGVLMERDGVSANQAHARLRQFSQRTDVPLRERAEEIIASRRRGHEPARPEARGEDRPR